MKRTWKPITAGILNMISGIFFLIGGITIVSAGKPMATMVAGYVMYSMELSGTPITPFITATIAVLATALIILGAMSILGGIFSIKRSVWGLALAGSMSTLISLAPLGVPAVVFTALSKKEFG